MIIDGHAHCAGAFFREDTLVAKLDELGVDKVVLCQNVRGSARELRLPFDRGHVATRSSISFAGNKFLRLGAKLLKADKGRAERNAYVLSLAEKRPARIIPFYWADPSDRDAVKDLDLAVGRDGFRGIKLHQCVNRFSCAGPVLDDIAALAAEKSVPVFIHLYSRGEVGTFMAWARRSPRTRFVVAHMIGLEIMAPFARDLGNVTLDISPAWGSPARRVEFAAAVFGAERLTLGSDTPFGQDTLKRNIDKVRNLALEPEKKALILGLNMARLLNLATEGKS